MSKPISLADACVLSESAALQRERAWEEYRDREAAATACPDCADLRAENARLRALVDAHAAARERREEEELQEAHRYLDACGVPNRPLTHRIKDALLGRHAVEQQLAEAQAVVAAARELVNLPADAP